ncbi:hypothetical protein KKG31_02110 [Patescibacteria group bacterium]|nr:hypothetical protein [Patescibacteria group bacterium]MBU1757967.1 hypothetical protein [Patescibacteria group bacterium]
MPSTFGKQKSFLDYLEEGTKDQRAKGMNNVSNPFDLSDFLSFQKYFDPSLKEVQNIDEAIKHQIQTFSKEQEY